MAMEGLTMIHPLPVPSMITSEMIQHLQGQEENNCHQLERSLVTVTLLYNSLYIVRMWLVDLTVMM